MSDTLDTLNRVQDIANNTTDALRASGRAYTTGTSLLGLDGNPTGRTPSPTPTSASSLELSAQQGASVLESPVQISNGKKYFSVPAPTGTRIIIPRQVSSTGQERYLGAHALESIINLMNGSEKCGNIVIFDASNKPSLQYYDIGPNGEIFLKGTNKEINLSHEGSNASVILSEKEFEVLRKALSTQTNDVTHFKTTKDRGNAEDSTSEKGSWFSRNWWKILLGLIVAAGIAWGGIALDNKHKEKKEKKAAQAAANANVNENSNTAEQTSTQNNTPNTSSALTGTNITNEQANISTTSNTGNSL